MMAEVEKPDKKRKTSGNTGPSAQVIMASLIDPRTSCEPHPQTVEESKEVALEENRPERSVKIGLEISKQTWEELIILLREYKDVFAFTVEEMLGIDPSVVTHRLNVDPNHRPLKQKKGNLGVERNKAVEIEVQKLLAVGFIKECVYPEWVANVVMVGKPNGTWYVDFTDLNKGFPKDSFPLPKIDRLVDSTAGRALLSFLDAFSRYNQLFLAKEDQERTTFITKRGLYYYWVMSFGLKNAGSTYQRLINKQAVCLTTGSEHGSVHRRYDREKQNR